MKPHNHKTLWLPTKIPSDVVGPVQCAVWNMTKRFHLPVTLTILRFFLTCNERTGQCSSRKCTSLVSECENTALQRAFKLDDAALATAETWHLKGHTMKSNNDLQKFYHTAIWTLKDGMKWIELKFKFLDYVNSRSIQHLSFKQHCTAGLKEQTSSIAWETFFLKKACVNIGVKRF